MTEGKRESIKLHANYLNGVAVSIFAIGGVGFLLRSAENGEIASVGVIVKYLGFAVFSLLVHFYARWKVLSLDRRQ